MTSETSVGTRQCERCGELAAPAFETGLEWLPVIVNRLCFDCVEAERREEREAEHRKRVDEFLAAAGGAPRWRGWSLDTYPADAAGARAKADAVAWFERLVYGGEAANLLLLGGVGSGKTGLAWSLVRAACENETPAMLVHFGDFLTALKRSFRTGEGIDRRLYRVQLLALDDLGAERPTDFARDELLQLVEHRYRNELPTIVTSNYVLSELGRRLGHDDAVIGKRIVSRLADGASRITFDCGDRRTRRAA